MWAWASAKEGANNRRGSPVRSDIEDCRQAAVRVIPVLKCVMLCRFVGRVSLPQGIAREIREPKPLARVWRHVTPKHLPKRLPELLKGLLRLSIYFDLHGVTQLSGKDNAKSGIRTVKVRRADRFAVRMATIKAGSD